MKRGRPKKLDKEMRLLTIRLEQSDAKKIDELRFRLGEKNDSDTVRRCIREMHEKLPRRS